MTVQTAKAWASALKRRCLWSMPHATVSGIASTMLMMVTAVRTLTALPFRNFWMISGKERWQQSLPKTSPDLDATTSKPERIWKSSFLNTVSAILQSMMVMIPTSNPRWILPRSETSSMKCTPKTLPEKSRVPFGHARKAESISPAAHRLATRKTLPTTITLWSTRIPPLLLSTSIQWQRKGWGFTASPSGSTMKKFWSRVTTRKRCLAALLMMKRCMIGTVPISVRFCTAQSTPDTSSTKPSPPCPWNPKSDVIFRLKNALSFRIHMKQSSHKTVGRTCSESFTAVPAALCAIRPTTTISSRASSAVQIAAERC